MINTQRSLLFVLLFSTFIIAGCKQSHEPEKIKPVVNPAVAHVQSQILTTQKKMEILYPQLTAIESAARTNNSEIQTLFDEMTAKRKEYQAKLNELPEMKSLHDQLELNQAELGMLLERQQVLVTQESKQ
jgi:hypothetical protein